MQIRPCFSSASRRNLMSRKSEKYSGSKPVSASVSPLDWHAAAVKKGIAFIGLATPVGPIATSARGGRDAGKPVLREATPVM